MSRLHDLPAELRNIIYKDVLESTRIHNSFSPDCYAKSCVQPSLARTDKAIRAETLPLWYGSAPFCFDLRRRHQIFDRYPTGFDYLTTGRITTANLQHVQSFELRTRGFVVKVDQAKRGSELKLRSLIICNRYEKEFGHTDHFYINQAIVEKQVQEALDYMASDTDREGKTKIAGFVAEPSLLRHLFAYLIRVAVRVEESELDVADADGIEFLFDDRRCTTKEIRRAVRYGYLHL